MRIVEHLQKGAHSVKGEIHTEFLKIIVVFDPLVITFFLIRIIQHEIESMNIDLIFVAYCKNLEIGSPLDGVVGSIRSIQ